MAEIVQSVGRALSILELLSDYNDGLGITKISELTKLHKSTVHRLLGTLIYEGYVIQDGKTNRYKLSMKLFELGSKKIRGVDMFQIAKPYTNKLMKSINEVVHLVVRDGTSIVYIDKVEADNVIRMASNVGRRSPLYCTSVGKAILAFMDEADVDEVWEKTEIIKYTDNTIVDLAELKEELAKIRVLGYAEDDEENELGVRCVGAPVFNFRGEVEGAISISGPTIRVTKNKVDIYGEQVKGVADLISKELGYSPINRREVIV